MADNTALTVKDRGAYYRSRVAFLNRLLLGTLSPKQRREAEAELLSAQVKAHRFAPVDKS